MTPWPFSGSGDGSPLTREFRAILGLPVDEPAPKESWIDKKQRALDRKRLAEIKRLTKARRQKEGQKMHGKVKEPGFTKAQLAGWGVSWPPPKGWKKALERRGVVCVPEGKKRKDPGPTLPYLTVGMDEAKGGRQVPPLSAPLGGRLGSIRRDEGAFLVHFDGACWPNPGGIVGWGATIARDWETLHEIAGGLPAARLNTNNVAEYLALTAALEWLLEQGHGAARVHVRGDSRLVLRQMFPNAKGKRWKLKDGSYLEYARAAWMLLGRFSDITGEWVPREGNRRADALSQQGVREVAP